MKPVVKVKLPPLDVREELESEDLLLHTNVGQVPQQQPQRRDGKRSDALPKKVKNEDSRNKPESGKRMFGHLTAHSAHFIYGYFGVRYAVKELSDSFSSLNIDF